MTDPINDLIQHIVTGERRALARALRLMDDDPQLGHQLALKLHPHLRGAEIVGITGNPGAGKSTLCDAYIAYARRQGRKVAVLAVDPSSPFSGGAILGDRIRMNRHATDDGVFIRSLATRGALGGVSHATAQSARVLDAAGYDLILIETVGVGQDEIDVARLAETTVVVMTPGLGDDIQAIKAGLLEIADIFVINKADREGVAELERALRQSLSLSPPRSPWSIPVLRMVAAREEGIEQLSDAVADHHAFMQTDQGRAIAAKRSAEAFEKLLDSALIDLARKAIAEPLARAKRRLLHQGADPYAEVESLIVEVAKDAFARPHGTGQSAGEADTP